jgi:tetratricopeptide (TPR) repeat protein
MPKIPVILFLLGITALSAFAAPSEEDACFKPRTNDQAAIIKACSALLQRPILTPEWKLHALFSRGSAHVMAHELDAAIADFSTLISLDPQARIGWMARGGAYTSKGDFRSAQKDMNVLLGRMPDDPRILNNSCWLHAALKEFAAAEADCRKSLALKPDAVETLDSLGFTQLGQRAYRQALATYNAALAQDPKHAASLYVRGVIKRRLGDIVGGNADMAAAGKIDPEIAEYYAPYGLTQGN